MDFPAEGLVLMTSFLVGLITGFSTGSIWKWMLVIRG